MTGDVTADLFRALIDNLVDPVGDSDGWESMAIIPKTVPYLTQPPWTIAGEIPRAAAPG